MGHLGEIFCLAASLCWSITPLITTRSLRRVGTYSFTSLRFLTGSFLLGIPVLWQASTLTIDTRSLVYLVLSGLVGIAVGDLLLFHSLRILGPRRCFFLFALNIPMTLFAASFVLGESITDVALLGCLMILAGVLLINAFKQEASEKDKLDSTHGRVWMGVGCALLSAMCQAAAILLIKVGVAGVDNPIFATWIRLSAAGLVVSLPLVLRYLGHIRRNFSGKDWSRVFSSSLVGNVFGMSFLTLGIKYSDAGIAAFLTSLAPIFLIPLVAIVDRRMPRRQSLIGAAVAAVGIFLVFQG